MTGTATSTTRGWRTIERYAYVERAYDEVWPWLAGHLSTIGEPLPDGGRALSVHIRPGGKEISRPVRLRVGGLVCADGHAEAALDWADAEHPRMFPTLTATLEIVSVPNPGRDVTQVGVRARYRPPFGPVGAIGDRMLGVGVVDVTLTNFLDDLVEAVAETVAPSPRRRPSPNTAAGPEAPDGDAERVFLTVDGLAVRPGGAVGVGRALAALPGVVGVAVDPFTGLVAVDHDPARCGAAKMTAALVGPFGG